MKKTSIAVFGLGKMGSQIAKRLHASSFDALGWNRSEGAVLELKKSGVYATTDINEAVRLTKSSPRIFWIMLPSAVVDEFLFGESGLGGHLQKGDIVIDGGNSFYKDSILRSEKLKEKGIYFFDCGTSGGIWGEKNGFALMVGGPKEHWPAIEPIVKALSSGDNYAYLGASGAGHFTKMVHNGIEYGMMEAIAEGYGVLEASPFNLNLSDITRVYQKGSVIQSWLIDLCRDIFEKEDIAKTSGKIDSTGEGEWTIQTAKEFGVDARVIEDSFKVRQESADPKNQNKFSNKLVALMRKYFGGHDIYRS